MAINSPDCNNRLDNFRLHFRYRILALHSQHKQCIPHLYIDLLLPIWYHTTELMLIAHRVTKQPFFTKFWSCPDFRKFLKYLVHIYIFYGFLKFTRLGTYISVKILVKKIGKKSEFSVKKLLKTIVSSSSGCTQKEMMHNDNCTCNMKIPHCL